MKFLYDNKGNVIGAVMKDYQHSVYRWSAFLYNPAKGRLEDAAYLRQSMQEAIDAIHTFWPRMRDKSVGVR
jgi:hypothetical protein